ncbi:FecR domain-containing protein [Siphonobacter sp. BAB-5385]|uniref:FecR domain-containing protein n=1 Tax=Siphonobacter sp. BAB-5385 TaxID=1864822 RepID=UPI0015956543|nr:FecR family protein [Siphonobacter sp. BAB-5385]
MNPINQEQYFTWLDEWERQSLQMQTNQDKAWETITNQLENTSHAPLQVLPRQRFPLNLYGLAVSLLACVLIAGYLFKDQWQIKTLKTQPGEVRTLELPDGSQVILNSNSTLSYNRFSFKNQRNIQLTGEAEFNANIKKTTLLSGSTPPT